jgi:thiol-disulfide isomerase/thioredoxin
MDLSASLFLLVLPGDTDAARRILLVRSTTPRGTDHALSPLRDASLFRLGEGSRLAPLVGEAPPPQTGVLERLLPSSLLPFEIPPPGDAEREEEVAVYGAAVAKLPVRSRVEKAGPLLTVTRSLLPGRTVLVEIDGSPSTVERWSETHVIDTAQKVLREARREHRLVLPRGEGQIAVEGSVELKVKEARTLDRDAQAGALKLGKDVQAILEGFGAKRHPREVYDLIKALAEGEASRLAEGLHDAFVAKLSYYRQAREAEARKAASRKEPLVVAPDFTLESMDGKKVSFKEFTRDKVTLLAFWGFNCPPCRAEAPYLTRLQETYGDRGFTVLAVNAYDEPRDLVQSFVERGQLKHPILLGGGQVARDLYQVRSLPTTVWLDASGKVVARESGFSPSSFPRIEARVKEMLAAKAGAGKP